MAADVHAVPFKDKAPPRLLLFEKFVLSFANFVKYGIRFVACWPLFSLLEYVFSNDSKYMYIRYFFYFGKLIFTFFVSMYFSSINFEDVIWLYMYVYMWILYKPYVSVTTSIATVIIFFLLIYSTIT